jgi:hypothetical protein
VAWVESGALPATASPGPPFGTPAELPAGVCDGIWAFALVSPTEHHTGSAPIARGGCEQAGAAHGAAVSLARGACVGALLCIQGLDEITAGGLPRGRPPSFAAAPVAARPPEAEALPASEVSVLAERAAAYTEAAKAPIFSRWCAARGLAAMPATPATVLAFLVDHAGKVRISTLQRRLAAIREAHRYNGTELDTSGGGFPGYVAGYSSLAGRGSPVLDVLELDGRDMRASGGERGLRQQILSVRGDGAWGRCSSRRTIVFNVDTYPEALPVPAFGPRMVCTGCGMIGADARPNWRERYDPGPITRGH